MTLFEIGLTLFFTIIILTILISIMIYLIVKRNSFPYSNISSRWVIITLFGVCLNQISSQILFYTNHDSSDANPPDILFERINILLIRHLIIIPLLVRVYCLGESIKYNYHHISRKFYDKNFQSDKDDQFRNKFYNRNYKYYGMFIIPLAVMYTVMIILNSIPFTNCSINNYIYSLYSLPQKFCNGKALDESDEFIYDITGSIIFDIILLIEICFFLTFLFRVIKYPIEHDKFLLKFEFISSFIIWTSTYDLYYGFTNIFSISSNINFPFYIRVVRNIGFALVYAYVTYKRKNITNTEIKGVLKDFDSFMYCHVSFTFFRDFIKSHHQDDYKLLSFWIEYHLYKRQTQHFQDYVQQIYLKKGEIAPRVSDNTTLNLTFNTQEKGNLFEREDHLREMAEHIFIDYFEQNRINANVTTNAFMSIEFPVDIYEKVEDAYRTNFNVENILEIFDEAHRYVSTKLFNLYSLLCRDEKEFGKLEKVLFFIDFYEIKRMAI